MITNEMKAKIFGLHIGCKVAMSDHNPEYTRMLSYRVIDGHEISIEEAMMWNKKLILKPLSEITDEDAIEVAKIAGCNVVENTTDTYREAIVERGEFGDIKVNHWVTSYGECEETDVYQYTIAPSGDFYDYNGLSEKATHIIDFLRSKGYALPAFGIDLFESSLAIPKQ